MKKTLFLLPLLILIFIFREKQDEVEIFSGIAMTVPYRIVVGGAVDRQDIEKRIQNIFQRTHQIYNKWNPDSELSKLNRSEQMACSKLLLELLRKTDEMWRLTEGRFDPTIEGAVIGWNHLKFEGETIHKPLELKIDLGGIAKGQTIDELTVELQQLGLQNLLVEWGGDFRASGSHPSGRPWIISIVNPFGGTLIELELQDAALATSGDYEQFHLTEDGRHLTHIIDPSTGKQLERVPGSIVSCSVESKTGVEADAIATALMLFKKGEELKNWTLNHPEYSFHFLFFNE